MAETEQWEYRVVLTDDERLLLNHLVATHHQWHPNKKADAWVSSACFLLRKLQDRGDDTGEYRVVDAGDVSTGERFTSQIGMATILREFDRVRPSCAPHRIQQRLPHSNVWEDIPS